MQDRVKEIFFEKLSYHRIGDSNLVLFLRSLYSESEMEAQYENQKVVTGTLDELYDVWASNFVF